MRDPAVVELERQVAEILERLKKLEAKKSKLATSKDSQEE